MDVETKRMVAIGQIAAGAFALSIVGRAYNSKGYELTGWQKTGMFFGYFLLYLIGDFYLGTLGGFCGFGAFVVIGLLRVAALPANYQQEQPPSAPQPPPAQPQTLTGIVWNCTACKRAVSADENLRGTVLRCPLCNAYQRVPYP